MDRPDIDPLQIPHVICNIFEFLPFEEKKKWRALSRTFHEETLKSWSKCIVFTLNESLPIQNGRILNNVASNETSKGPEEEMQLREVPIVNFRLVRSQRVFPEYTTQYLPDPRWDFALFLERSGNSLRSLHIDAFFRQGRFVDYFKLLLFKYCKNLKELSIRFNVTLEMNPGQKLFDEGEEKDLPELADGLESLAVRFGFRNKIANTRAAEIEAWKGILSLVPNIKRLKVGGYGLTKLLLPLPSPLHSPAMDATPTFLLLTDLEIDTDEAILPELTMDGFRSLRIYMKRAKPDLKRLRYTNFYIDSIRSPPYYFHQFISDCKFTLTRLQLSFIGSDFRSYWISDLTGIDFQNLTVLILFESNVYVSTRNYTGIFDFRALRGMKKLKVFRCIAKAMASPYGTPLQAKDLEFNSELEGEIDWTKQVAARNKVDLGSGADPPLLEELGEFSFFLRGRLSAGAVRQLGKWMPSVKKLGLIADRTLFPVLIEVWGKSLNKVVLLGPTDVTEELIEETTQGKTVEVEVLSDAECYEKFNDKTF